MKSYFFYSFLFILMLFTSCKKDVGTGSEGTQKYSFWQGAIANKYYLLDICGGQTGEVTGKPYMILEYDPLTSKPIKCEFGLSEAVYKSLPRSITCIGSPPQPLLSSSMFDYSNRLSLKGSVDLLTNWTTVINGANLSGGGFDFTVNTGNGTLHFEKTNEGMTGEIMDEGQSGWGDAVSASNAFNLLHKFNSTTIGN